MMKLSTATLWLITAISSVVASPLADTEVEAIHAVAARTVEKRNGFTDGQPIDGKGKGAPILGTKHADEDKGGTNHQIDLANPDNLAAQSTDSGTVVNLKWSFSDSKTKIFNGGWTREQVVTDLPGSHDIAGAQQHLKKGALRELHWHKVAEWGYVYAGSVLVSAVDENGHYQVDKLEVGDIWYFPKGSAHTVQGLADENEYLLVFDDGDFDALGTTFMVDDWIAHTPKSVLAKNFGVNESVFDTVPTPDPYIINATVSTSEPTGPESGLTGNSSYVYHHSLKDRVPVPGGGGNLTIVDSRNFPIAKTLAATIVSLEPGGLRELHWHPNAEEWLYFHSGNARATVFIGGANARTFDFTSGDTAVFPDNSGHYIENTSKTENLVWIEIYKSDRVADIPLTQWLALTPPDIVASTLKIPLSVVNQLKKEKQVLIKGNK
ncbi:putative thermophilic glucose-6-phosphate isomerase [Venustampulla echinocandica]|uniref:Putative thermophilic glucose-6-phosphate isomerase n=1 Tax=Venustampulla echinocandica TaxID=2656787 RepID=A0A370U456_9HELO|nr:putative thermophilic glucose-6-phosphate isomerase [Venustampulla echinocandica]RDL42560.1 putative thermophilic glucose-6-phosphate isomerase [Venustampulla echinocandica]